MLILATELEDCLELKAGRSRNKGRPSTFARLSKSSGSQENYSVLLYLVRCSDKTLTNAMAISRGFISMTIK